MKNDVKRRAKFHASKSKMKKRAKIEGHFWNEEGWKEAPCSWRLCNKYLRNLCMHDGVKNDVKRRAKFHASKSKMKKRAKIEGHFWNEEGWKEAPCSWRLCNKYLRNLCMHDGVKNDVKRRAKFHASKSKMKKRAKIEGHFWNEEGWKEAPCSWRLCNKYLRNLCMHDGVKNDVKRRAKFHASKSKMKKRAKIEGHFWNEEGWKEAPCSWRLCNKYLRNLCMHDGVKNDVKRRAKFHASKSKMKKRAKIEGHFWNEEGWKEAPCSWRLCNKYLRNLCMHDGVKNDVKRRAKFHASKSKMKKRAKIEGHFWNEEGWKEAPCSWRLCNKYLRNLCMHDGVKNDVKRRAKFHASKSKMKKRAKIEGHFWNEEGWKEAPCSWRLCNKYLSNLCMHDGVKNDVKRRAKFHASKSKMKKRAKIEGHFWNEEGWKEAPCSWRLCNKYLRNLCMHDGVKNDVKRRAKFHASKSKMKKRAKIEGHFWNEEGWKEAPCSWRLCNKYLSNLCMHDGVKNDVKRRAKFHASKSKMKKRAKIEGHFWNEEGWKEAPCSWRLCNKYLSNLCMHDGVKNDVKRRAKFHASKSKMKKRAKIEGHFWNEEGWKEAPCSWRLCNKYLRNLCMHDGVKNDVKRRAKFHASKSKMKKRAKIEGHFWNEEGWKEAPCSWRLCNKYLRNLCMHDGVKNDVKRRAKFHASKSKMKKRAKIEGHFWNEEGWKEAPYSWRLCNKYLSNLCMHDGVKNDVKRRAKFHASKSKMKKRAKIEGHFWNEEGWKEAPYSWRLCNKYLSNLCMHDGVKNDVKRRAKFHASKSKMKKRAKIEGHFWNEEGWKEAPYSWRLCNKYLSNLCMHDGVKNDVKRRAKFHASKSKMKKRAKIEGHFWNEEGWKEAPYSWRLCNKYLSNLCMHDGVKNDVKRRAKFHASKSKMKKRAKIEGHFWNEEGWKEAPYSWRLCNKYLSNLCMHDGVKNDVKRRAKFHASKSKMKKRAKIEGHFWNEEGWKEAPYSWRLCNKYLSNLCMHDGVKNDVKRRAKFHASKSKMKKRAKIEGHFWNEEGWKEAPYSWRLCNKYLSNLCMHDGVKNDVKRRAKFHASKSKMKKRAKIEGHFWNEEGWKEAPYSWRLCNKYLSNLCMHDGVKNDVKRRAKFHASKSKMKKRAKIEGHFWNEEGWKEAPYSWRLCNKYLSNLCMHDGVKNDVKRRAKFHASKSKMKKRAKIEGHFWNEEGWKEAPYSWRLCNKYLSNLCMHDGVKNDVKRRAKFHASKSKMKKRAKIEGHFWNEEGWKEAPYSWRLCNKYLSNLCMHDGVKNDVKRRAKFHASKSKMKKRAKIEGHFWNEEGWKEAPCSWRLCNKYLSNLCMHDGVKNDVKRRAKFHASKSKMKKRAKIEGHFWNEEGWKEAPCSWRLCNKYLSNLCMHDGVKNDVKRRAKFHASKSKMKKRAKIEGHFWNEEGWKEAPCSWRLCNKYLSNLCMHDGVKNDVKRRAKFHASKSKMKKRAKIEGHFWNEEGWKEAPYSWRLCNKYLSNLCMHDGVKNDVKRRAKFHASKSKMKKRAKIEGHFWNEEGWKEAPYSWRLCNKYLSNLCMHDGVKNDVKRRAKFHASKSKMKKRAKIEGHFWNEEGWKEAPYSWRLCNKYLSNLCMHDGVKNDVKRRAKFHASKSKMKKRAKIEGHFWNEEGWKEAPYSWRLCNKYLSNLCMHDGVKNDVKRRAKFHASKSKMKKRAKIEGHFWNEEGWKEAPYSWRLCNKYLSNLCMHDGVKNDVKRRAKFHASKSKMKKRAKIEGHFWNEEGWKEAPYSWRLCNKYLSNLCMHDGVKNDVKRRAKFHASKSKMKKRAKIEGHFWNEEGWKEAPCSWRLCNKYLSNLCMHDGVKNDVKRRAKFHASKSKMKKRAKIEGHFWNEEGWKEAPCSWRLCNKYLRNLCMHDGVKNDVKRRAKFHASKSKMKKRAKIEGHFWNEEGWKEAPCSWRLCNKYLSNLCMHDGVKNDVKRRAKFHASKSKMKKRAKIEGHFWNEEGWKEAPCSWRLCNKYLRNLCMHDGVKNDVKRRAKFHASKSKMKKRAKIEGHFWNEEGWKEAPCSWRLCNKYLRNLCMHDGVKNDVKRRAKFHASKSKMKKRAKIEGHFWNEEGWKEAPCSWRLCNKYLRNLCMHDGVKNDVKRRAKFHASKSKMKKRAKIEGHFWNEEGWKEAPCSWRLCNKYLRNLCMHDGVKNDVKRRAKFHASKSKMKKRAKIEGHFWNEEGWKEAPCSWRLCNKYLSNLCMHDGVKNDVKRRAKFHASKSKMKKRAKIEGHFWNEEGWKEAPCSWRLCNKYLSNLCMHDGVKNDVKRRAKFHASKSKMKKRAKIEGHFWNEEGWKEASVQLEVMQQVPEKFVHA